MSRDSGVFRHSPLGICFRLPPAPPTHTKQSLPSLLTALCTAAAAIRLHLSSPKSLQVPPSTQLKYLGSVIPLDPSLGLITHFCTYTMSKKVKDTTLYDVLGVTPEATDIECVATVTNHGAVPLLLGFVGISWLMRVQAEEGVPKEGYPGECIPLSDSNPKLIGQYHPDKNPSPEAETMFKEVG